MERVEVSGRSIVLVIIFSYHRDRPLESSRSYSSSAVFWSERLLYRLHSASHRGSTSRTDYEGDHDGRSSRGQSRLE